MNKFVGLGLLIIAVLLGLVFVTNRGSQIRIEGTMEKVRLQQLAENSTLAVFDFRFSNPADYPFVVSDVTSTCTLKSGTEITGELVTDADVKPLFEYHALTLGAKFNESLIRKSRVAPKTIEDRMIAMTYPTSADTLATRMGCVLHIKDVDGAVSDILESPAP